MSFLFFLSSCQTYFVSVESFKQQFGGIDSSKLKDVTVLTPIGSRIKYKALPVTTIKCIDNKGKSFELFNRPSIEIRFTDSNNKRTIFYFDRINVTDTSVTGVQSRIISSIRKTISLKSVRTIEIQDGRKRFRYVD